MAALQLFHLTSDPEEAEDLAEETELQEKLQELRTRLAWHLSRAVPPLHAPPDNNGLPIYSFPPGQAVSQSMSISLVQGVGFCWSKPFCVLAAGHCRPAAVLHRLVRGGKV